jgi:hypothetical protein
LFSEFESRLHRTSFCPSQIDKATVQADCPDWFNRRAGSRQTRKPFEFHRFTAERVNGTGLAEWDGGACSIERINANQP